MKKTIFAVVVFGLLFPLFSDISFASPNEAAEKSYSQMELSGAEKRAQQEFDHFSGDFDINRNSPADKKYTCGSCKDKSYPRSKFYISGGYNINDMHYKEISKDSDTVLDKDFGDLSGFYAAAGYKSRRYIEWLHGRPFIEGYFQRYSALINYESPSLAFDDEHAKILLYGAKLGAYRNFSKKGDAFGYLDIGKRVWYRGQNRIIQSTVDYAEKYWWTYFGIGAGMNYEVFPRVSVGIEAEGMYSPESLTWMRADLYEGGTFDLGMVLGAEVKFPIKFYLLKTLSLDFTPYLTYWEISKSTNTAISGTEYYEPYSQTHIEGILLGATYSF
jgi:hypothetical protein